MSTVRYIIQGSVKDNEAFNALAKRACSTVEEQEPNTLAYEWFTDEKSGTATIHELFSSPDAFLDHFERAGNTGVLDELMGCMEIQSVTSLNRIEDERVQGVLDNFGAAYQHGLAGVSR